MFYDQDEQHHQHGEAHDQQPKCRMPTTKAVSGGFSARLVARCPSAVLLPVRQTTIVAVPLMTEVPAKTALDAPAGILGTRGQVAGLFLSRI
jgi:hypothetical protein